MKGYLLSGFALAVFIAIMVGINRGISWAADFLSTDAIWGFLAGFVFCAGIYFLSQWMERSSGR